MKRGASHQGREPEPDFPSAACRLRSQALRDSAQEKWVQLHKILITEIKETAEITQPPTLREHEASMFKLLSSFLVTHRSISFTLLTSDLDHKPERVFQLEPLVMTVNSKPPVILSCTSESPLVLERTSKGEKNFPWSLVPSRHERRAAQCSETPKYFNWREGTRNST